MARTIEGLLDKIYFSSVTESEKGSRFEKLIVAYLHTAGQYADLDPVRNPYTPNAGARPLAIVGRDDQLQSFDLLLGRLRRGIS